MGIHPVPRPCHTTQGQSSIQTLVIHFNSKNRHFLALPDIGAQVIITPSLHATHSNVNRGAPFNLQGNVGKTIHSKQIALDPNIATVFIKRLPIVVDLLHF